jgi:hypothetical protein
MASTSYQCAASHDLDRLLLQIVANLEGISLDGVISTGPTSCVRSHAFYGVQETAVGLVGSLRLLSMQKTDLEQAQVNSWMDVTEQGVMTILRSGSDNGTS